MCVGQRTNTGRGQLMSFREKKSQNIDRFFNYESKKNQIQKTSKRKWKSRKSGEQRFDTNEMRLAKNDVDLEMEEEEKNDIREREKER